MITVDTKNIELETKNMDKLIEEYTNNSYDVFYELSKLNSYWSSMDSIAFLDNVNKEKENSLFVIDDLKSINNIYKRVLNTYEEELGANNDKN